MDKKFESRYKKAVAAARRSDRDEPRALSAVFDERKNRVIVELSNRSMFLFPTELAEGLAGASKKDLKSVEITPSGDGLHWGKLDVDLSITGLLMGIFGSKTWMRELGRQGGLSKSKAKSAAARRNGQKGGRPRRVAA